MRIEEVWYGHSRAAQLARAALGPASLLYAGTIAVRRALYDRGILGAGRAPAPVVSVGGLSVGGSGKTPFVLWLALRLARAGQRPCIVTRGYGGSAAAPLLLQPDVEAAVERAGDEAVLLSRRSRCTVAVGADRLRACELAMRELAAAPPTIFVLDDGFQHRALARDLDIVLLGEGDESAALLPAGPLREGPAALSRADFILRPRSRPALLVRSVADSAGEDAALLAGRRVVAVAAIARPERFLADLERLGANVAARVLRRDHHRFDAADRREIESAARGAELIVTTEKDLVRLGPQGTELDPRLRALRIDIDFVGKDAVVERTLGLLRHPAVGPSGPSHAPI